MNRAQKSGKCFKREKFLRVLVFVGLVCGLVLICTGCLVTKDFCRDQKGSRFLEMLATKKSWRRFVAHLLCLLRNAENFRWGWWEFEGSLGLSDYNVCISSFENFIQ